MADAALTDGSLRSAYEQARHRAESTGLGFRLANDENRIDAEFTSGGMKASHPEGAFGLRLEAYGYGERLSAPLPASLHANGRMVELRRGALVEWYFNDKRGLEQGFTLREAPGESRGERLVVELAVTGDLTPVLAGGVVFLERDGAAILRYDGLRAWDATGRELTARMEVRGRRVRLVVDDRGAAYPVVIDPWVQQQKLTAADGAALDSFGSSVSLSGDTAVIGAPEKSSGQGAVYVFVRSGNTWSQQQKLTAADGAANDGFGVSVSVSRDTAVIGAYRKAGDQGAAYVFVRSGITWSQQQKLTAADGMAGDQFGSSVSLNADTAVIGAPIKTGSQGAAYVFVRSGSVWSQQQKLTAADAAANDAFGVSVSVNGETALVGAIFKAGSVGAAYVYLRSGGAWSQQQKLTAADAATGDYFGISVSVSASTAVIGAYLKGGSVGAAYVYLRSGSIWSQQQKLTAADGAVGDYFGISVAVSGDTAVIGAPLKASSQGVAYLFTRSGGIWSQQQKLMAADGAANDQFGAAVAVSGDTVLIGADLKASGQGAAYVFTPNDGAIPFGSSWRYLVTPSDPGTAWRAPAFDDSAWPSGSGRLGYGDVQSTVIGFGPDPNNKYITTYFRKTFAVATPSQITSMVMSLVRDDGAVVYLNGTEVVRSNMPSGAIAYGTLAASVIAGNESVENLYSINPALLVAGTNVIAVEVHQAAANSNDLGFDLKLALSTAPVSGGLKFVPMTPCRLVDTRPVYAGPRTGAFGPPLLPARVERTIPINSSTTCSVPVTAKAYVFNVTLDTLENGTGPFDCATIWPSGEPRPDFCTARSSTGGYIANAAIVRAGTGGAVTAYSSHDVNLIIDINGYFTDDVATPGLLYYPINPCRAVDTRGPIYSSPRQPPYGNQKMQAQENRSLRLPGNTTCALPAAAAYSMQLTLAPGDLTSGAPVAFITAYPTGVARPGISNMNSIFGYAVANSAIVPANASGSIDVFAFNQTNLIIDVNGYFAQEDGTGRGLLYYPAAQCRLTTENDAVMTTGTDRTFNVPVGRCPGLPSLARAWALNAAVLPNGTPVAFLSMWPTGTGWPNISQLNAFEGQMVANSGIVPASANGSIDVRVLGTSRVVLEVSGYFAR